MNLAINNVTSAYKQHHIRTKQRKDKVNFDSVLKNTDKVIYQDYNDISSNNKIKVTTYNLHNREDIKNCSKSYGNMEEGVICDFKKNSPEYYTGNYIHEYDLSNVMDSYDVPLKNGKVFGFTSCNNAYNVSIRFKGNKEYIIRIDGWQKDKVMDQKTFEDVFVKGLKITMAEERQLQKISGSKNNLFASAPVKYNPNTKKADFSNMINSAIDSIPSRLERVNGNFNKNMLRQYIDEFIMEISFGK